MRKPYPRKYMKAGDLVEHLEYPGFRGIVREVQELRPNGKPRYAIIMWLPASDDNPAPRYNQFAPGGETRLPTMRLKLLSSLPAKEENV